MGIRGGRGRGENLRVSCFLSFTAAEAIWRERLVRVKFFLGNCFVALQVSHVMSHDPVLPHPLYYLFQFTMCTSPSVPHPPFIMETVASQVHHVISHDPNPTVPHPPHLNVSCLPPYPNAIPIPYIVLCSLC